MNQEKTGALITKLRKQKGMTQKQLAEQIHVSITAISKWENGVNAPDLSNLQILSEIFGVSLQELVNGEINVPESTVSESSANRCEEKVQKFSFYGWRKIIIFSSLLIFISIGAFIIYYWNFGPPRFHIVDTYYDDPSQEYIDSYGFDKTYYMMVEYSGKFEKEHILNYDPTMTNSVPEDIYTNGTDMICIYFYDDYDTKETLSHVTVLILSNPENK